MEVLGRVLLPPTGTSVGVFEFLVDPASGDTVAVDTPVSADTDEGTIIGVVTDMRVVGPDSDPLRAAAGPIGSRIPLATTVPTDAVLASVQVFHAPSLRPVRSGTVRLATRGELSLATGSADIAWPIPMGVLPMPGGEMVQICTDGLTLLGPEGAHLMLAGRSGMAAKTSYASVLLKSAFTHATAKETVAALLFNVKGPDLVFLDKPPAVGYELTPEDLSMYKEMGISPEPFDNVTVYAPSLPGHGTGTRSERSDAVALKWGLRDVWPYLRFFAPALYASDNSETLIEDLKGNIVFARGSGIDSIDALINFLESEVQRATDDEKSTIWHNHHIATARRVLKFLVSLPERLGGLISRSALAKSVDVPVEHFSPGEVVVVDIAGLEPLVQSAVIARTLDRLHKHMEKEGVGVNHLVVFADELNVFAPATGGEVPQVRNLLAKIAATGRYAGVSLWGAAQFMSQVHNQVRDNAATSAMGVLAEAELDSGVYGRFPAGQRERIVTLPKGSMAVRAYNLRGVMTLRFPRPAWQTGREKDGRTRKGTERDVIPLSDSSLGRLTEGMDPEDVRLVISEHDGDVEATVKHLEKLRVPDMKKVSAEGASSFDPENVWDLD
jgi:hypothetical protein